MASDKAASLPKYSTPVIVPIGLGMSAVGQCVDGTGATNSGNNECTAGPSAVHLCTGGSANF